jgi:hypothetical protein
MNKFYDILILDTGGELNSEQNVQASVATDDNSSNAAGKQNPVEQKDEPKDEVLFYCRDYETGYDLCDFQCEACTVAEKRHPESEQQNPPKVEPQPAPKEEDVMLPDSIEEAVGLIWGAANAGFWKELNPQDCCYRIQRYVERMEELLKVAPKTYTESEVREIVGRTWDAANKWEGAENWLMIPHHGYPDKETFINGLFK